MLHTGQCTDNEMFTPESTSKSIIARNSDTNVERHNKYNYAQNDTLNAFSLL